MSSGAAATIERLDQAAEHFRTPCGDGHMKWRAWGKGWGEAPAIVFLHGGFGSWLHSIRNIEPFAADHRVLAADLPGLGESEVPHEPLTPEAIGGIVADGLASLLDDATPVHLVGFSFGGLLSGQVATVLGARISTLTLVGASGLGLKRPWFEMKRRSLDMSEAERAQALRFNLMTLMLRDEDNADDLALLIHERNDANARLRSRKLSIGDSLRTALPRVTARLAGVWGEHDATAGEYLPDRRTMLQTIQPGAPFQVIDGAGHWVQYEAADRFNGTLRGLLSW